MSSAESAQRRLAAVIVGALVLATIVSVTGREWWRSTDTDGPAPIARAATRSIEPARGTDTGAAKLEPVTTFPPVTREALTESTLPPDEVAQQRLEWIERGTNTGVLVFVHTAKDLPIPRARLTARLGGYEWSQICERDGGCLLEWRRERDLEIDLDADGYARKTVFVSRLGPREIHIELARTRSITGRVVDTYGRPPTTPIDVYAWTTIEPPLPGAILTAEQDPTPVSHALCNRFGEYRLDGIAEGVDVHLFAGARGFAPERPLTALSIEEVAPDIVLGSVFGGLVRVLPAYGGREVRSAVAFHDPLLDSQHSLAPALLEATGIIPPVEYMGERFHGDGLFVTAWQEDPTPFPRFGLETYLPGFHTQRLEWTLPQLGLWIERQDVLAFPTGEAAHLTLTMSGADPSDDPAPSVGPHYLTMCRVPDGERFDIAIDSIRDVFEIGYVPPGRYELQLVTAAGAGRSETVVIDLYRGQRRNIDVAVGGLGSIVLWRPVHDSTVHGRELEVSVFPTDGDPDTDTVAVWHLDRPPFRIRGLPPGHYHVKVEERSTGRRVFRDRVFVDGSFATTVRLQGG